MTTPAFVVSIHDENVALAQVLDALGAESRDAVWLVTHLDAEGGDETRLLVAGVLDADGRGVLVPGVIMAAFAASFERVSEAELLAFPAGTDANSLTDVERRIGFWPESQARHCIRAIDGAMFEVMTKSSEVVAGLERAFKDVRREDPSYYF